MNRDEVLAKVIECASIAFNKDKSQINENTNIAEELGVQSSQRTTIASLIENEYDVMVPVARFGKFKTIGDLVDYVMDNA